MTAKMMSAVLRGREEEAGRIFYRDPKIPKEVSAYRPPVDPDELLSSVTLARLQAVFIDVMRRSDDRVDPVRSSFGKIEKEEIDAGALLKEVEEDVQRRKKCTFRSLLTRKKGKMYVVVAFLSILELMKTGRIAVSQESAFGEIMITANDKSLWTEEIPEEQYE